MEDAIDKLDINQDSFVVIATNHQDQDAITKVVDCDTRYIGLMASRRKVQTLFNHLRKCNVSEAHIQAIHSPIGFNIGAETPDEIAISIMAEVLKIKHQSAGGLMKDDTRLNRNKLVLVRGAGDIATGVAIRLKNAGFKVVMTDISQPTVIRCTVSFAQCLYGEPAEVEGVTARKANSCEEVFKLLDNNQIPVMVDEDCCSLANLKPTFVVDAILAKRNLGLPVTWRQSPSPSARASLPARTAMRLSKLTGAITSAALSTMVSHRPTPGSPAILQATLTSEYCVLRAAALCITTSNLAIS